MFKRFDLRRRVRASAVHLLVSLALAVLVAALVFGLWYPGPYRLLSGGRELFFIVLAVDVILGPLLTLVVFNPAKSRRDLWRDLTIIALLQIGALGYGLYTVMLARPIAMVFEVDRFRVLSGGQIRLEELAQARPEYRSLPLTGPWLLATRKPLNGDEANDALFTAIGGVDVGQRPKFWQPYADSSAEVLARSRPVEVLLAHYSQKSAALQDKLRELAVDPATTRFLPVMARGEWVVLLDRAGGIQGFLPVDGFF